MNTIEYFYFCSSALPGVTQKVEHTVSALSDLGYTSKACPISGGFFRKRVTMLKKLLLVRADVVVIRYEYLTALMYLPILIAHRLMGRKIILDVPTPLCIAAREIISSSEGWGSKCLKLLPLYIQGPFAMWAGNLVLQYAPESKYFSFGLARKIIYTSNGIDTASFSGFRADQKISGYVRFVCVGAIARWHGIDRLIKGIANYNKHPIAGVKVTLNIVGQGEEVVSLQGMVDELELKDSVFFLGQLMGDKLLDVYRCSDIGVGTLGLHRKNLNSASPLKNREYCSVGLPILLAHDDVDFDFASFCMRVDSTDSPINVAAAIEWYTKFKESDCSAVRIKAFAENKLDFRVKWLQILEVLE